MSNKRWLPLEANPEVMNTFSAALGLNTDRVAFHEVYGIDPEMLAFVPRPVHAVLLLFPIDERSEEAKREEEERIEREGQTLSENVYFMNQTVGNACGTVALLHGILNNMDTLPVQNPSFLTEFYARTGDMTPMERAHFLESPKEGDPDIEQAHRAAATAGETRTPGLDEKVDLHFVCLVQKDGGLYELDGRKKFPIYHGPSSPPSLLEDSIGVARIFMDRNSDETDMCLAFGRATESAVRNGIWKAASVRGVALLGSCLCVALLSPLPASASNGAAAPSTGFSILGPLNDFVLHLDARLGSIIAKHGAMTYALLFGIVFCETGLVLTPFLPGDSLLFVAGALAGLGKLNFSVVSAIFITAAILGDALNYAIGAWLGQKAVNAGIISKSNVSKTERFFEQYGGKTIVLARFGPIVRTFAPFVAGMSHMEYQRFAAFNTGGALLWTLLFCGLGFFFGNLPFVEKNFSLVMLAIVVISVLPVVYEIYAARKNHTTTHPQT